MIREKKTTNRLILLLIGVTFILSTNLHVAKASKDKNDEILETRVYFITNEGEVIYNPDFVVLQGTDDNGNQSKASTKSLTQGYTVYQSGNKMCDLVHNVTFNYGISTPSGLIAWITNANAYITYAYPDSLYYGRLINTSISNNAQPATFASYIDIYKKSNNQYEGQIIIVTRCYSSGQYY